MKVLVINCGSSSLKYQLIDMDNEEMLCKGLCERIGIEGGIVTHKVGENSYKKEGHLASHADAFNLMLEFMTTGKGAVLKDKSEIKAVGHRVVHGGEKFTTSAIINDEVVATLEELSPLVPLHNPPQLVGIRSAQQVFGADVPQVAVFDTSFHQTMPPYAYIFAVPYKFYTENAVRRYGFHGTSHRYVGLKAAEHLGKPISDLKIVTCHLGNGSSITAIDNGHSVDTSMGLTPLGGIMMGTRSGDLDPSVATFLAELTGRTGNKMSDMLNKESGFLGVSGISSDNRDIEEAAQKGDERALLVHDMFAYQIKKFIGAYTAAMNGLDCVVFTGGIGENSAVLRADVCGGLTYLGIDIDYEENQKRGQEILDVSTKNSRVKTLVIQTNEELMIARDTAELGG